MCIRDSLSHSLLYGAVLSALLSAFIVATLLFRPMIWINDAPPDLRAAAGPMSAADHRFQRVSGAVFILLLVCLLYTSWTRQRCASWCVSPS